MPVRLMSSNGLPEIVIDRPLITLGRHRLCDVRLDSTQVSRHHCCLARDQHEVVVRDLGSTNGTWINGQRVAEGRLRPGDELAVGRYRYRLLIDYPGCTCSPSGSLGPDSAAADPADRPSEAGLHGSSLSTVFNRIIHVEASPEEERNE